MAVEKAQVLLGLYRLFCVLMQFDLIAEFFKAGGSRRLMFFYQEVPVSQSLLLSLKSYYL